MPEPSLEEVALAYAARSWAVFPLHTPHEGLCSCGKASCRTPGKHPRFHKELLPHGALSASTDEATIRAWWRKWPDANVGLAPEVAGLVSVSSDSAEWAVTFRERGLPPTACIRSGGGPDHLHWLYRRPPNCPKGRINKSHEYDIIAKGVVVLPPSLHPSGARYVWEATPDGAADLPYCPQWAVEMLHSQASVGRPSAPPLAFGGEPPVRLPPGALRWWNGEECVRTPEGAVDRSTTLYDIGLMLASAGASATTIATALAERDRSLSYLKYSPRPEAGGKEYARIAQKALSHASPPWGAAPELRLRAGSNGANAESPAVPGTPAPSPEAALSTFTFERVITAAELQQRIFPPLVWPAAVLLPEGFSVLVGREKIGKSRLTEEVCIQIATGSPVLGHSEFRTTRCRVLLLALEEDYRLLQERCRERLGLEPWPDTLHFATEWPRMDEPIGTLFFLRKWLEERPDTGVVVVDTFKRVRPRNGGKRNAYEEDYDAIQPLHALSQEFPGLAVLVILHANKRVSEDDFDTVSGSTGLLAVPDRVLILQRKRGEPCATLSCSGRRGRWRKFRIRDDELTGQWRYEEDIDGSDQPVLSSLRLQIYGALKGKMLTPLEVAEALGREDEAGRAAIRRALMAMHEAGQLSNTRHRYCIHGDSVKE